MKITMNDIGFLYSCFLTGFMIGFLFFIPMDGFAQYIILICALLAACAALAFAEQIRLGK